MLGAITLWSTTAPMTKFTLQFAGVWEIVLFRVALAATAMWAIALVVYGLVSLRRVGPWPFIMGILEPGMVTVFLVLGVSQTSAVNGAVVWGILPVTQPLLARLILKEPLQRSVAVGAVLAVGGTAMLFASKQADGSGTLQGDLFLVCAVLAAACNQLLARRVAQRQRNPVVVTGCQMTTATCIAVILFALFGDPGSAYDGMSIGVFGLLCYLALTTAGPFFLYNYALQHLPVGAVSLFAPLVGPLGAIWAALVLGDVVNPAGLIAIAVILAGALMPTLLPMLGARVRKRRDGAGSPR